MEITLEKIELVRDRTGVTYKEAKEALEKTCGNVVDAIILLEESVNEGEALDADGKKGFVKKIKEILAKGNIVRIVVKQGEKTLLDIPLTAGVVGTVIAPWGVIIGVVAAVGFKCTIEFVKENGTVINLSEKAEESIKVVREKGSAFYSDIKEKAPEAFDDLKDKGSEALNRAKYAAKKAKDKGEEAVDEAICDMKEDMSDLADDVDDIKKEIKDGASDIANDAKKTGENLKKETADLVEDAKKIK